MKVNTNSQFFKGATSDGTNVFVVFDDANVPQALFISHNFEYYVEPAWRHIVTTNHSILIGYANVNLDFFHTPYQCHKSFDYKHKNSKFEFQTTHYMPSNVPIARFPKHKKTISYENYTLIRPKRALEEHNRCSLLLVADWRFFKAIGNNDVHNTVNYLVGVIGRMNAIFNHAQFRIKDSNTVLINYGFVIRQIIIHTQPNIMPKTMQPTSLLSHNKTPFKFSPTNKIYISDEIHINNGHTLIDDNNRHKEISNLTKLSVSSIFLHPQGYHDTFNNTRFKKYSRYSSMSIAQNDDLLLQGKLLDIEHYNSADYEWMSVGKLLESFSLHRPKLVRAASEFNHDLEYRSTYVKNYRRLKGVRSDVYKSDVCLAHLFTHQPFKGNILGLAYVASDRLYRPGGICTMPYNFHYISSKRGRRRPQHRSKQKMIYLNTGFSSYQNEALRTVFTQEGDIITAHEFGHNWGSEHDIHPTKHLANNGNLKEEDGAYIMHPYSLRGYDINNNKFSSQSLLQMGTVLHSKAHLCFIQTPKKDFGGREFLPETETSGYCGNRILENDEECDTGSDSGQTLSLSENSDAGYIRVGSATTLDKCCDVRNCRLRKPHAICSDRNHECCTPECQIAPFGTKKCKPRLNLKYEQTNIYHQNLRTPGPPKYLGKSVDISQFDKACYRINYVPCSGLTSICSVLTVTIIEDALNYRYTLGLDPSVNNQGVNESETTNGPFQFYLPKTPCRASTGNGYCDGLGRCQPFCEYRGLASCLCTAPNETCLVCCKTNPVSPVAASTISSICTPYTNPALNITQPMPLTEGEPCTFGYCDKHARCQKELTDYVQKIWNYIEVVHTNNFKRLMKDNLVGTIVLLTAFLWLPISFYIHAIDLKRDLVLKRLQNDFMNRHRSELGQLHERSLKAFNSPSTIQHQPFKYHGEPVKLYNNPTKISGSIPVFENLKFNSPGN